MSPNVERLALWADRLDDPASKQARRRLRDADGAMCCLGHACEVYREHTGQGQWDERDFRSADGSRVVAFLPDVVAAWYGTANNPVLSGRKAAALNDDDYRTLPEIAVRVRAEFGIEGGAS